MRRFLLEVEVCGNEELKLKVGQVLETILRALVDTKLAANTRKAYRKDAYQLLNWLVEQQINLVDLTQTDILNYRRYLCENFAKASAARKLVVARRLLSEAVERNLIPTNPAQHIAGIETEQETSHNALTKFQARQLLEAVDLTTKQGKRDYALLLLLLKTGMRRSECASLRVGDLQQEYGHSLLLLRQTKGNKRRKVKLAVEVKRALDEYTSACGLATQVPDAPLFIQFRRGDHPKPGTRVSEQLIQRIVEKYTAKAELGLRLTPHGLRATFVTLALEGGAKLEQVQYAVGHADPRTTERYQKRKLNLDDAATDYVKI